MKLDEGSMDRTRPSTAHPILDAQAMDLGRKLLAGT